MSSDHFVCGLPLLFLFACGLHSTKESVLRIDQRLSYICVGYSEFADFIKPQGEIRECQYIGQFGRMCGVSCNMQ